MYVFIISICIVAAAVVVQRFANKMDEQLNACGTGSFKDGICVCQHPYTGTHCELVDCGYGKLVDSVFAYDTITTPNGPAGCECESQYWGYNCQHCTSKYSSCTGPCEDKYYGTRCDTLCKLGTENDAEGVLHRLAGGTYNYYVSDHGFCLNDGTVKCREGRAGAHCEEPCSDCVYGKCNLNDGTCDCFDGYFGDLCDGTCPGRCSGLNGVCQEGGICNCYDGFTGDDCSLACCVEGRGTSLSSVHGNCAENVAGCACFEERVPHSLPFEVDLVYHGIGWEGSECDCHENITCGGRGTCGDKECICAPNFQGIRCDICADDKIGPFCQYDRWQCPSEDEKNGEFVPVNSHGDYACKCNSGFTGDTCEDCIASAYPKEGPNMCTYIIPASLCHIGTVNPSYDGTGYMCVCPGQFDNGKDCAVCEDTWFGPNCDVKCEDATCRGSGGVCSNAGPGCMCPKGLQSVDGMCVACRADGQCANGECLDGRCQCDPGFYGDLCDITAPSVNGKVCNGFAHVLRKEDAPCVTALDCTNPNHPAAKNRLVAIEALRFQRDMICHRDDSPFNVEGCCVDSNADGFCDAANLESNCTLEGELVEDICNTRALEGEVNVYEWCLSQQRGCTRNGECGDPELCTDMCDNQNATLWESYWQYEHSKTMESIMSEPWRFPIDFEDPYNYRASYTEATKAGVCASPNYRVCRDALIPDATVYNVTHKFTGVWEPMPSYACGDVHFLSRMVNGTENYTISTVADGFHALLPNTAVFAVYNGQDVTSGPIDSLTLIGKGEVQVVLYNSSSDTCEDFILKAASVWDDCKDVTFFEFDYDWTDFCASSFVPGEFNETCYAQSSVCEGCEDYQEGCEGLPINMTSPMPAPCNVGWESFCPDYLKSETNGTCAYAKCECEGYGVGGEACSLQCPVPSGVRTELSCGSGEDPPWGKCIDVNGTTVLGYEQGECYCFNGGDPAKGCTRVCDGAQDCSQDIDTPFEFEGNCSDFSDVVRQNGTSCTVNLRDSLCNYYRGRCECATPFTLVSSENQTVYKNPSGSYRVALMQGYDIYEYLPFTTHEDPPSDLVTAFDDLDPGFKCFKDLSHTKEVSCDWIRALKHFARGGSYRVGDCHNLAPGTKDQIPCSGHGFPVSGTCACDYAEEFEVRSTGVGLAFELPGLTETPWRGKNCGYICPGYDMKTMGSVCSGHGLCASDGRCSCDQGWTGYKCDLRCEQADEVLSCSGHGTCDERLYRRGYSDEKITESFDTNCTNETMYLARDRVILKDGVVYHMYDQAGLKITMYPGTTRDATVDDFFVEGSAVRHPHGYESVIPFMPCKDTLSVKREEAVLPFGLQGTETVFIDCNVLPGYEVRCGECTCEETSQTGHWAGHDCRTPAFGYFNRDARSTCPGMVDGEPCNGGGTCMWGSVDGMGQTFGVASGCYCGDPDGTLATVPRTENNRFIVHAMNGDTPLYRKVFDSVLPENGTCPEGTVGTDVCVPLPLELENYNKDCSCKFGFTGTTCETPRMMCLFSGTESQDGLSCDCRDNNGFPNSKVNDRGCCTKGTYWNQGKYKSFSLLVDFLEFDNLLLEKEFESVCTMAPTTTELTAADMHDYIVNTDEYFLEPSSCDGAEQVPLYNYVYRHMEDADGDNYKTVTGVDKEQECLQHCGDLEMHGFNLKGNECRCLNSLSFIEGSHHGGVVSVFDESFFTVSGNGKRYDIVYPSGCFESEGVRITSTKQGPNYYLVPQKPQRMGCIFSYLVDNSATQFFVNTLSDCVHNCLPAGLTHMRWDKGGGCYCGTSFAECPFDDPHQIGNGSYIIKRATAAKHMTKVLPNPLPCNIDSYLAYPDNMDNLCECPIWDYEDCGSPTGETLKYNVSLDEEKATKHSCIAACTKEEKGTARVEETDRFLCHCGDECISGTGAYRLEHLAYRLTSEGETCDGVWEFITDSQECSDAARYLNERGGSLPTTVNPPAILPPFYLGALVWGCSLSSYPWYEFSTEKTDTLIYADSADVYVSTSTDQSFAICKRNQECKCDGFYMKQGEAFTCPAGKFSDSCSSSCKECPVGWFSQEGANSCNDCPGGYIHVTSTSCEACLPGTYSLKGANVCTDCPVGYYADKNGLTPCKTCEAGQYSESKAAKAIENTCQNCPSGQAQYSIGQISCVACNPGRYANVGGLSSCKPCGTGKYQGGYGKTSCASCGGGKYQNQIGQSGCKSCPAGYESISSLFDVYCGECEAGTYSEDGWTTCKRCDTGRYTDKTAQGSCKSCGVLWRADVTPQTYIWVIEGTQRDSFEEGCDQGYSCGGFSNVDGEFYGFSGDGDCGTKNEMLGHSGGKGDTWRKCCYYRDNSGKSCADFAEEHGDNSDAWEREDSPWGGYSLCSPDTYRGWTDSVS